jgi:Trp operon repressor
LVATVKVSVPFVSIEGWLEKKFVAKVLTLYVSVWLDSSEGPADALTIRFEIVCELASSAMAIRLVLKEKMGASFTAVTVASNVLVTVCDPSSAIKVMVAGPPFLFDPGINVMVRLVPVPLTETETKALLEELAVRRTLALSTSVRVNATFVLRSSNRVRLVIPTNTGALFTLVATI